MAGKSNTSATFFAQKKLLGKANTSNLKTDGEELIGSNIQASTSLLFGQSVPANPTQTLYLMQSAANGSPATVEYIHFASTGNGADFGDLTSARLMVKSINNLTRGVTGSGATPSKTKKIDNINVSDRAKLIQPVFQDPYSTLNPIHTIGYIVSRPLMINENKSEIEVRNEVVKTLNLVGLSEDYYNRFPNQLSGGQRQRVAIASAIILKPQILICDDPTSALDVTIQSQILDLLSDLKAKLKITIILISHDISVVKYFSDRIIVMYNGEIIESGNSKDIISVPKNNYTKKLMSSVFSLKK